MKYPLIILSALSILVFMNAVSAVQLNYSECIVDSSGANICSAPYPNITIPTWNQTCFSNYYPIFQNKLDALSSEVNNLSFSCQVNNAAFDLATKQSSVINNYAECIDTNKHYIQVMQNQSDKIASYTTCDQQIQNLTGIVNNDTKAVTGYYAAVNDLNNLKANYLFIGISMLVVGVCLDRFVIGRNSPPLHKGGQDRILRSNR